jgi:hypothetical protein
MKTKIYLSFIKNAKELNHNLIFKRYSLLFLLWLLNFSLHATELIGPSTNGDFHSGFSGWNVVNGTSSSLNPNQWQTSEPVLNLLDGNYAFISDDAGISWNYANSACFTHFYKDVHVPAGEGVIELYFDWICYGENLRDGFQVSYASTSTSVSENTNSGYNSVVGNQSGALVSGATLLSPGASGFLNQSSDNVPHRFYATLPSNLAGTDVRIIFSWRNDAATDNQGPAAIDNVLMTSGQIGNNKTLYVDFFGLTIFYLNEDNAANTFSDFEREDDLIKYINDHSIDHIILKYLDKVSYGNTNYIFPEGTIISTYPIAGASTTSQYKKQHELVDFLHRCRQHGVKHIGAGNQPFFDNFGTIQDNDFFENIVNFNVWSVTQYPDAYFDMLYAEYDYWEGTLPAAAASIRAQWLNYIGGLQHINSIQITHPNIIVSSVPVAPLLIGTYLGDLEKVEDATTVAGPLITEQAQADLIDLYVDWVFLEFYFPASQLSPTKFFSVDNGKGKRLQRFASNSYITKIIPLFGSSAAYATTTSAKNYYGDYLHFEHVPDGIFNSSGTVINSTGTLTAVKDLFEYYYTTTVDPYGTGSTLTMQEICEGTIANPNPYANTMTEGSSWFKYSTMPDSRYLLRVSRATPSYPSA